MTDRVGLARAYYVWPTPRHFTADDAALDLLGHVLGGGKTSRLYRALVREKQIAQDVQAYQDGQELTGEFAIVATVRPGPYDRRGGGGDRRGDRAHQGRTAHGRAKWTGRSTRSRPAWSARMEAVGGFGGRADQLNLYNTFTGDPGYLAKDFARYPQVDAAAVQKMARQYLGPGRVVVEVEPGSAGDDRAEPVACRGRGPRTDGQGTPLAFRERGRG